MAHEGPRPSDKNCQWPSQPIVGVCHQGCVCREPKTEPDVQCTRSVPGFSSLLLNGGGAEGSKPFKDKGRHSTAVVALTPGERKSSKVNSQHGYRQLGNAQYSRLGDYGKWCMDLKESTVWSICASSPPLSITAGRLDSWVCSSVTVGH